LLLQQRHTYLFLIKIELVIGRLIDESPKWLRASGKSEEAARLKTKLPGSTSNLTIPL